MNTIISYIDGANLQKALPNIDYKKFHQYLTQKHKSSEIIIFLGHLNSQKQTYKKLHKLGYKIIFKEAVQVKDGKTKANVDAELVLQATSDIYEKSPQKTILISGDGDFSCLIDFWKKKKIKTKVLAPTEDSCSSLIKKRTTKLLFLNQPKIYNQIKKTKTKTSIFTKFLTYLKSKFSFKK